MTDKLEEASRRGERAKALLTDPLIKEAFDHIEGELWRHFKAAAPDDEKALSHIKQMQYMHSKYVEFLGRAVTSGRLAKLEIEQQKRTLKERVRDTFRRKE